MTPSAEIPEQLRADLANGSVIVLLGAGVSKATNDSAPNWVELIERGAAYARANVPANDEDWLDWVRSDLNMASSRTLALISAAEKVQDGLGGPDGPEFKRWLRSEFEDLRAVTPDLIAAIGELGCPILTTNFDGLAEEVLGRDVVLSSDTSDVLRVLKRQTNAIWHLNGHWRTPGSLVFGALSYGAAASAAHIEALKGIFATRTVLMLGFGGGMSDPTFIAVRRWLAETFGATESAHFRLCLLADYGSLSTDTDAAQIKALPYGSEYSDLAGYLRGLAKLCRPTASLQVVDFPNAGRAVLVEHVRAASIIADHLDDPTGVPLDGLVVPPVVLPMSPARFAQAQRNPEETKPRRSEFRAESEAYERFVLFADENSGQTTALEWMLHVAQPRFPRAVPLLVDFRSLQSGSRAVERQIRSQLRAAAIPVGSTDPLPDILLAIDNAGVTMRRTLASVVKELESLSSVRFLIIGCNTVAETDMVAALAEVSASYQLRYLGAFKRRDIRALAALVDPNRAAELADRVASAAESGHLPKSPFILGLLISVLLNREGALGTASETALLDAYLELLLGRGDVRDNSRMSFDAVSRERILAVVAAAFVTSRTGSMHEREVLVLLTETFESLGWRESASELLQDLVRRRVLRLKADQVMFIHTSYLHLFAAKHAQVEGDFLECLLADPLYYAPILKHYAALTRSDRRVLESVSALLSVPTGTDEASARSFEAIQVALESAQSLEQLLERLGRMAPPPSRSDLREREAETVEALEDFADLGEPEPFPLSRPEESGDLGLLTAILGLVSSILRDSELIVDLDLKQRVLQRTLQVWGVFVGILEKDESFTAIIRKLGEMLVDAAAVPSEKRAEIIDRFQATAPMYMAYGGMSISLATQKLVVILERCMEDADFREQAGGMAMAALLAIDLRAPGWPNALCALQQQFPHMRALNSFFVPIAQQEYLRDSLQDSDATALLDFLARQDARSIGADTPVARARIADVYRRRLTTVRMQAVEGGQNELDEELL